MLKINNLNFSYGDKNIFNNFSLEIKDGEKIWLSAPSGFGKTTLIKLILGLLKPQKGVIDR